MSDIACCPACRRSLRADAVTCTHCGAHLVDHTPAAVALRRTELQYLFHWPVRDRPVFADRVERADMEDPP